MRSSDTVRGAVAGVVGATAWLVAQPVISMVTGSGFDDVRLLGRLVSPGGRWRITGVALHVASGAVLGGLYATVLRQRSLTRAVTAAQLENALSWPCYAVIDRFHPDRRNGRWPPLATTGSIVAHEALTHLVFGAVLGMVDQRLDRMRLPVHG